jgi:hypothetical protein
MEPVCSYTEISTRTSQHYESSRQDRQELWQTRKLDLSDKLSNVLATFYRGRVIFKQCIHKKCKHFGVSIYHLCQQLTHDVSMYFGKKGQNDPTQTVTNLLGSSESRRYITVLNHCIILSSYGLEIDHQ